MTTTASATTEMPVQRRDGNAEDLAAAIMRLSTEGLNDVIANLQGDPKPNLPAIDFLRWVVTQRELKDELAKVNAHLDRLEEETFERGVHAGVTIARKIDAEAKETPSEG